MATPPSPPPHFYINPLFQVYPPILAKNFIPSPSDSIFGRSYPPPPLQLCHVTFCKFWIVNVTCYLIAKQLNWSHTQFVCAWIGHGTQCGMWEIQKEAITTVANCWLITKIMWLTGNYNLPLIISLDFLYIDLVIPFYLWVLVCSSACWRYEPLYM